LRHSTRRTCGAAPPVFEPVTEHPHGSLEDPSTGDSLTLLSGHIKLTDDSIAANGDKASKGSSKLRLLRVTAPWTLGTVGVLLALVGIFLAVTGRSRESQHVFID
jgi:hypothetical protein